MPANASRARHAGKPAPTSSAQRACRILEVLSDRRNSRLTDIAAASGQGKATALRLLDMLMREGFVVRDPHSKRYALGPEIFVLGAAAAARFDPRPIARPSLIRLVSAFEDSAMLSIARGAESVCIDVEPGSFPIRATYLEVGSRRPLGAGAGSLALLSWLPDSEVEALMPSLQSALQRYPGITRSVLAQHIAAARERGYALMLDLVVDRMGGIAMPIFGGDGRPVAAISIAALTERIVSREKALAEALRREIAACQTLGRLAARESPVLPAASTHARRAQPEPAQP